MIVYLDTSALVKQFLDEPGTERVLSLLREAQLIATSLIAYAEVRAALARAVRMGILTASQRKAAVASLDAIWPDYFKVSVSESVVLRAGGLADKYALRGYDAVHLASAVELSHAVEEPLHFAAWDKRLLSAAGGERLHPIGGKG